MIKNNSKLTRRLLSLSLIVAASALLFIPSLASAAEINPAQGSYSYGSTSEYSASSANLTHTDTALTATPLPSKSTLASTGDPASIVKLVALGLIGIGTGVACGVIIRNKSRLRK